MEYYQKQKKIMLVAVVGLLAFIIIVCSVSAIKAGKKEEVKGEEIERYLVTIHKSTEGLITCLDDDQIKEEDDNKLVLEAEEGEKIILDVLPDDKKLYLGSEVMDENAGFILVSEESPEGCQENEKRISFTMPASDLTVMVNYMDDFTVPDSDEEEDIQADQEEELPYDITVKGMTKKIEETYRGYYDETDFIRSIGNWFGMVSLASDYHDVSKVTFTNEKYKKDTKDTVSHYLYFNDDKDWKILATFEFTTKTYQFVDIRQQEKEEAQISAKRAEMEKQNTPTPTPTPTASASASTPNSNTGNNAPTASYTEPQQQQSESEEEIELSITDVSSAFLDFVGNEEVFHTAVSEYLFGLGFTGKVNGKFIEFTLDEEKGEAQFVISLGESGAVYGTYDQSSGTYGF